ncbi:MAG: type I-E CRISPR-associated protein Cas6/Cse3/CasE [Acidobacteriota bacterium]
MAEAALPTLHMVQLHLDTRGLLRSAQRQGLRSTEDLGYSVHGHLAALFGELAPRPFRTEAQGERVQILGYGPHSGAELLHHADAFAPPLDRAVLQPGLASKQMPSAWRAGQRLRFEVRLCPTVRLASAAGPFQAKSELDAYQAAWARHQQRQDSLSQELSTNPAPAEAPESRATVYRRWLRRRLEPATQLLDFTLEGLRRTQLLRRTQGHHREQRLPELPDALVLGELEVVDPRGFAALLARGVGRHRAFGFGMLLLRPPSRR